MRHACAIRFACHVKRVSRDRFKRRVEHGLGTRETRARGMVRLNRAFRTRATRRAACEPCQTDATRTSHAHAARKYPTHVTRVFYSGKINGCRGKWKVFRAARMIHACSTRETCRIANGTNTACNTRAGTLCLGGRFADLAKKTRPVARETPSSLLFLLALVLSYNSPPFARHRRTNRHQHLA